MGDNKTRSTPERSDATRQTRYQFSMRVLFLLPVAIALPIAVGYLTNDLLWGLAVVLAEIVVAAIYPPTRILAALVTLLFLFLLLLSFPRGASRYAYRSQCANNLKRIGLALHNYHDTYGCFPPAYVADEEGRPMHSWRVLILPFIEQGPLYEKYRFDEPWDGPNNRQLADSIRSSGPLKCPVDRDGSPVDTSYALVTGDGTAWGNGRSPQFTDFTDGCSETIMVVEIANSNIQWMEPRDLTIDQAMRGINAPAGLCISSKHPGIANILLVDASVRGLSAALPVEELRKLLTHQGEEKVIWPK